MGMFSFSSTIGLNKNGSSNVSTWARLNGGEVVFDFLTNLYLD